MLALLIPFPHEKEKVVIIENNTDLKEMYVPRCHTIVSRVPYFSSQKSLIGYLLQIHRVKESGEEGRII